MQLHRWYQLHPTHTRTHTQDREGSSELLAASPITSDIRDTGGYRRTMVPPLYLWVGRHRGTLVHSPQAIYETFSQREGGNQPQFDFCCCWTPEVCDKCTNTSLSPSRLNVLEMRVEVVVVVGGGESRVHPITQTVSTASEFVFLKLVSLIESELRGWKPAESAAADGCS